MKKNKYIIIILTTTIILICLFLWCEKRNDKIFIHNNEINKSEDLNNINVYLNVLNKNYSLIIPEGATVLDTMNISKNNNFSFKGKEYPSLGFFVEEINGVKGENGKYWIYYINEQQAEVGVSKYIVKNGDIISWKLK